MSNTYCYNTGMSELKIPDWLIVHPDVSQGAKLFFGHLTEWTGIEPDDWPPLAQLASELGVSKRTIRRYVEELRAIERLRPSTRARRVEAEADRPGFVYLLKCEIGPYKIGRAKEVSERIKTLAIQLPFDVRLVHHFPADDCVAAEAFLHGRFADRRLRGEWFDLTEEDVAWIGGIVGFADGQPVR
jgi:hypothetical protein